MNSKRYADMATIMEFCRIFTEQIYKCMSNAGLLKDGYQLSLKVGRFDYGFPEDAILTGSIELEKDPCMDDKVEWKQTRMDQMKFSGEEWEVYDDPKTEAGTIPQKVLIKYGKSVRERVGETSSKPYPPYDMWISAYDDPADVGGGQ